MIYNYTDIIFNPISHSSCEDMWSHVSCLNTDILLPILIIVTLMYFAHDDKIKMICMVCVLLMVMYGLYV